MSFLKDILKDSYASLLKEANSMTLFGKPASELDKEELLVAIAFMCKLKDEECKRRTHEQSFLAELKSFRRN
jgi:hypothetical protein